MSGKQFNNGKGKVNESSFERATSLGRWGRRHEVRIWGCENDVVGPGLPQDNLLDGTWFGRLVNPVQKMNGLQKLNGLHLMNDIQKVNAIQRMNDIYKMNVVHKMNMVQNMNDQNKLNGSHLLNRQNKMNENH